MALKMEEAQRERIARAIFATALAGFTLWYLFDARANSSDFVDLLLVQPVAIFILLLYPFVLYQAIKSVPERAPENRLTRKTATRIFGSMLLLAAYAGTLSFIGVDLATPLYVVLVLLLLGERRIWVLVAIPLVFTVLVLLTFVWLLQMPLPMLLIGQY
jgi:putative tricarboxylic transport membrane protein